MENADSRPAFRAGRVTDWEHRNPISCLRCPPQMTGTIESTSCRPRRPGRRIAPGEVAAIWSCVSVVHPADSMVENVGDRLRLPGRTVVGKEWCNSVVGVDYSSRSIGIAENPWRSDCPVGPILRFIRDCRNSVLCARIEYEHIIELLAIRSTETL